MLRDEEGRLPADVIYDGWWMAMTLLITAIVSIMTTGNAGWGFACWMVMTTPAIRAITIDEYDGQKLTDDGCLLVFMIDDDGEGRGARGVLRSICKRSTTGVATTVSATTSC